MTNEKCYHRHEFGKDARIRPLRTSGYKDMFFQGADYFVCALCGERFKSLDEPIISETEFLLLKKSSELTSIPMSALEQFMQHEQIKYEGDYHNGLRHGNGTAIWYDGSKYEGQWSEGKRHGQGKYTFPNGDHYEGSWQNDLRHGQGTILYANGDVYIGNFVQDMKYGAGTYIWTSSNDKYIGEFSDDKMNGRGTLVLSDGEIHVGQWDMEAPYGDYILIQSSGKVVKASWTDEGYIVQAEVGR